MKRVYNIFGNSIKSFGVLFTLLFCLFFSNVKGEDSLKYWNIRYKDGTSGTAKWLKVSSGYSFGSTVDDNIVIADQMVIDGFWIKAQYDSYTIAGFNLSFFANSQGQGSGFDDYWREYGCNKCGYIDASNSQIYNLNKTLNTNYHNAETKPGVNTLKIRWEVKNNNTVIDDQTKWSYVKYTIPGFNQSSISVDLGNVNQGTEKTVTFSNKFTHYPTSGSKAISVTGLTGSNFTITSVTSNTITVKYTASLNEAKGSKSTSFTVTEPYGKTSMTVSVSATVIDPAPTPLIAYDPVVSGGPQAELFGYIKYTGCKNIDKIGFVYREGDEPSIGTGSTPTITGDTIEIKASDYYGNNTTYFPQGFLFSKTAYHYISSSKKKHLKQNTAYQYKVFLHSTTGTTDGGSTRYYHISEKGTFTTGGVCSISSSTGDTIYYTIDNTKEANLCELRFPSLSEAVRDLKSDSTGHSQWLNNSSILTNPVVFEVVNGGKAYGNPNNSTWDTSLQKINNSDAIVDYTPSPTDSNGESLIIRAKDPKNKPLFKGGISLVGARNITLKGLKISRSSGTANTGHEYSALELGYCNNDNVNSQNAGVFVKADIALVNCDIEASAFTCIHAAGCDGLRFERCNFTMSMPAYTGANKANAQDWGASVKLIACKNVQFVRNSIKGSHATCMWMQHTQNVLIMNNVFWNDNKFTSNVAFLRPMNFGTDTYTNNNKITKIGAYYNTFYLADNAPSAYSVDFLRFGGPEHAYSGVSGETIQYNNNQAEHKEYYDHANIHFKWNNCYCYDDLLYQRNDNAFLNVTLTAGNFDSNNFWSTCATDSPDDPTVQSGFAFGSSTKHVNVPDQVCGSTAGNPDDLIIKGPGLNLGSKPSTDISGLGIASSTFADRFNEVIRPEGSTGWTYGAFQKSSTEEISEIIWAGTENGDWDMRGNWRTPEGERVNCAHSFSSNLKVTIPNGNYVRYDADETYDKDARFIPEIKEWGQHMVSPGHYYTGNARGAYPDEYVEAGRASIVANETEGQFQYYAKEVELEDGATIIGVENLHKDNSGATARYTEVHGTFKVPRSKWVLVGTLIKPNDVGGVRDVQSGDFYLDAVPQVYMREVKTNEAGTAASWKVPFSELWVSVPAQSAFAIRIPNEYGKYFLTADEYYTYMASGVPESERILENDSIKYDFYGRFHDDIAIPNYTTLTAEKMNVISNTYPANIKVGELKAALSNSTSRIWTYNSNTYAFDNDPDDDVLIHPQQGFVVKPTGTNLQMTSAMYVGGTSKDTYLRSASVVNPYCTVLASNINTGNESKIKVKFNELKDDSYNADFDGDKLFNDMEPVLPELYIIQYDKNLSTLTTPTLDRTIPLGLRLKSAITVRFALQNNSGMDKVELLDSKTGIITDLAQGDVYTISLPADTYEGRFFLNIGTEDNSQGDLTDVSEESADSNENVFIFSDGGNVVISSTAKVELETAYITDMAGKTVAVTLDDPHYNILQLNGAKGVYVIKAVGNSASRTEKFIIK